MTKILGWEELYNAILHDSRVNHEELQKIAFYVGFEIDFYYSTDDHEVVQFDLAGQNTGNIFIYKHDYASDEYSLMGRPFIMNSVEKFNGISKETLYNIFQIARDYKESLFVEEERVTGTIKQYMPQYRHEESYDNKLTDEEIVKNLIDRYMKINNHELEKIMNYSLFEINYYDSTDEYEVVHFNLTVQNERNVFKCKHIKESDKYILFDLPDKIKGQENFNGISKNTLKMIFEEANDYKEYIMKEKPIVLPKEKQKALLKLNKNR